MKELAWKIYIVIATTCTFAWQVGGVAIHFWTVVIAYEETGSVFLGFVALCLPVGSTLYWFIRSWRTYGLLGTWYSLAVLCWVALVLVSMLLPVLLERQLSRRATASGE